MILPRIVDSTDHWSHTYRVGPAFLPRPGCIPFAFSLTMSRDFCSRVILSMYRAASPKMTAYTIMPCSLRELDLPAIAKEMKQLRCVRSTHD
jgi:hypothetical protein